MDTPFSIIIPVYQKYDGLSAACLRQAALGTMNKYDYSAIAGEFVRIYDIAFEGGKHNESISN